MMTSEQFIENTKKGNAVDVHHTDAIEGYHMMIEELLTAAEPVLKDAIEGVEGREELLYPAEAGLLMVYASWDVHNKGRRMTKEEMLAEVRGEESDVPEPE
jgi:hypothetical protein